MFATFREQWPGPFCLLTANPGHEHGRKHIQIYVESSVRTNTVLLHLRIHDIFWRSGKGCKVQLSVHRALCEHTAVQECCFWQYLGHASCDQNKMIWVGTSSSCLHDTHCTSVFSGNFRNASKPIKSGGPYCLGRLEFSRLLALHTYNSSYCPGPIHGFTLLRVPAKSNSNRHTHLKASIRP